MSNERHRSRPAKKHTELPKTQTCPSPSPYGFRFPLVFVSGANDAEVQET